MVNREYGKYKRLFKCLGFTEKAGRELIKVFYRLDAEGSRSVDYDECAKFFEIDNTPFSKKCFMLMDTQGTGEINFAQFVVACWNYCTYDKNGLTGFSFKLYDALGNGQIPMDDVFKLVDDIYDLDKGMQAWDYTGTINVVKNSPEYVLKQAKRQIARACGDDKQMNILEFILFCKTHPSLLKSAFAIQTRLQKAVVSPKFWQDMTSKRRKLEKINNVDGVNFLEYEEVMSWLGEAVPKLLPNAGKSRKTTSRPRVKHGFGKSQSNGRQKGGKYVVRDGSSGKHGGKTAGGGRKLNRKSSMEKMKDWADKVGRNRKNRKSGPPGRAKKKPSGGRDRKRQRGNARK
jgi:Ca2+-binding EF-hand superfamily protein